MGGSESKEQPAKPPASRPTPNQNPNNGRKTPQANGSPIRRNDGRDSAPRTQPQRQPEPQRQPDQRGRNRTPRRSSSPYPNGSDQMDLSARRSASTPLNTARSTVEVQMTYDEWLERYRAFFNKYDQSKLYLSEALLAKSMGRETKTMRKLVERYGPEPPPYCDLYPDYQKKKERLKKLHAYEEQPPFPVIETVKKRSHRSRPKLYAYEECAPTDESTPLAEFPPITILCLRAYEEEPAFTPRQEVLRVAEEYEPPHVAVYAVPLRSYEYQAEFAESEHVEVPQHPILYAYEEELPTVMDRLEHLYAYEEVHPHRVVDPTKYLSLFGRDPEVQTEETSVEENEDDEDKVGTLVSASSSDNDDDNEEDAKPEKEEELQKDMDDSPVSHVQDPKEMSRRTSSHWWERAIDSVVQRVDSVISTSEKSGSPSPAVSPKQKTQNPKLTTPKRNSCWSTPSNPTYEEEAKDNQTSLTPDPSGLVEDVDRPKYMKNGSSGRRDKDELRRITKEQQNMLLERAVETDRLRRMVKKDSIKSVLPLESSKGSNGHAGEERNSTTPLPIVHETEEDDKHPDESHYVIPNAHDAEHNAEDEERTEDMNGDPVGDWVAGIVSPTMSHHRDDNNSTTPIHKGNTQDEIPPMSASANHDSQPSTTYKNASKKRRSLHSSLSHPYAASETGTQTGSTSGKKSKDKSSKLNDEQTTSSHKQGNAAESYSSPPPQQQPFIAAHILYQRNRSSASLNREKSLSKIPAPPSTVEDDSDAELERYLFGSSVDPPHHSYVAPQNNANSPNKQNEKVGSPSSSIRDRMMRSFTKHYSREEPERSTPKHKSLEQMRDAYVDTHSTLNSLDRGSQHNKVS